MRKVLQELERRVILQQKVLLRKLHFQLPKEGSLRQWRVLVKPLQRSKTALPEYSMSSSCEEDCTLLSHNIRLSFTASRMSLMT